MSIRTITIVSALSLLGACASHENKVEESLNSALSKVPVTGSVLPYRVLRDDLIDAKTGRAFEIRNGGYGSSMVAHPTKAGQFYALTDRGPNAKYSSKEFGKGKIFPTPNYSPRIGLFELQDNGQVKQLKTIILKRPNSQPISGLPNQSDLGGTGETPYHVDGTPILETPNKPFNKKTNPIKTDNYGLDGEGLVALSDGSFWVSDEYGPHIVHFDANGVEIDRINAFKADKRSSIKLPTEFSYRRPNRGMEGLAITPDEKTLVGIMQSTMRLPNKSVQKQAVTRIVTVNLETKKIAQYLYIQDKAQNSNSEITALGDNKFLVIERDGSFFKGGPKKKPAPNAQKKVYMIDLSTGTNLEEFDLKDGWKQDEEKGLTYESKTLEELTKDSGVVFLASSNIKPVKKELVVDMVRTVSYPHDKMEGLWLINKNKLGVLNDDDFATWSTKGKLEAKMLDSQRIDGNRLYIIDVDLPISDK